jgi:predicted dehydrogenase
MKRVAVIGCGQFGANHARVLSELPEATLAGVFDTDAARAAEIAAKHGCPAFPTLDAAAKASDAAIVAVPTRAHAETGVALLERGLDVLVEKPIARTVAEADALVAAAAGRILQVGHLERFNPAVEAALGIVTRPLFFEVHRMSVFSPRSLDVDVVLDLMIHDLDIVLTLAGNVEIEEIRAVGLAVLSKRVDIANVRLVLANGCVANLTASRVSTEKIRKLRFFQPGEYISLDYARQDVNVFSVAAGETPDMPNIGFRKIPTQQEEPLRAELRHFLQSVETRHAPRVDGKAARRALAAALRVVAEIEAHSRRLGL